MKESMHYSHQCKAMQTKLSLLSPPASEFLIATQFRVQQNLCFVSNKLCCVSKRKLVSLVPRSVIPVDASDSFDTILDVVRAGKYETTQKM